MMNMFVVYLLSWLLKYNKLSFYSKGGFVYQIKLQSNLKLYSSIFSEFQIWLSLSDSLLKKNQTLHEWHSKNALCVLKHVKTFAVNWLDIMNYLSYNNFLFSSLKQLQIFPLPAPSTSF